MPEGPAGNIPLSDVYVCVCGVMDRERVGIAYDRHPRLSYRTFYLEDCR